MLYQFIIMLILVKKKVPTNVRTITLFLGIIFLEWQIVSRTLASRLLCWWEW